jgi:predicted acyl esterase
MKKSTQPYSFWDNLIPIKAGAGEIQYAGWKPAKEGHTALGCRILANQRVPVAEEISLSADVYTPKLKGRYPAIVSFGAYSKELHTTGAPAGTNEVGSPPVFTNHGYCHVVVSGRGMGQSDGESAMFFCSQEADDHERTIAWAAAQPWCDGNVVLFGTSYYGMAQPLVALRNPPALKAFFCSEICTDYYRHLMNFGGRMNLYFINLWTGGNFQQFNIDLYIPPILRALMSRIINSPLKRIWKKIIRKKVKGIFTRFMQNTPILPIRERIANWMFDGKTRETNWMPEGPFRELSKINVPFVTVENLGMFNLHQFGSYDLFENAGTAPDKKWLILEAPTYELPVYSWQLEAIAFFNHILFGTDNGYHEQPRVRYWLEGKDQFAGATGFPVPESKKQRFYLDTRGSDRDLHALTKDIPSEGKNSWAAVPMGLPVVGGMDEVINQILSFEMKTETETEFSGAVSAHLRFSCNEIDSQVVARLGRVDAAGGYHILSLGTIAAARRRLDQEKNTACEIVIDTDRPEPLIPGEPVDLAFSLTPAPTRLLPGEKIRLDIASRLDLLKSDVSHDHAHFEMPAPPYLSRNTVHYGSETYLELHLVEK